MSGKPLIIRKESTRYPGLFVEKYTKRVFWDNLWSENPDLVESRGVVKDASGNVVIRPFTKIFNRGENGTDINRDETVLAVQKINGFMAAATYVPSVTDVVVSTTGSLDSDFVKLADKHLHQGVMEYIRSAWVETGVPATYLFEIVDSVEDPHIIKEAKDGAYLIGVRDVKDTRPYFSSHFKEEVIDEVAKEMGVLRPQWKEHRFSDLVAIMPFIRHEGFCVYGQQSRTALKMKSPYYLALKAAACIKDITSLDKKRVDEEFYPIIDRLVAMGDAFNILEEQVRLDLVRNMIVDDKES